MAADLRFLLDTNVIIQFEEVGSNREIKSDFQKLHHLLSKHSLSFAYHPLTENDLENDKDSGRQKEMLSRLRKYPLLDSPPTLAGNELEKKYGGINSTNDLIDCQLLFAVSRGCATYLITEDRGIHRRAENAGLDDRVIYVGDAIDLITRQFQPQTVQLPNIDHEHLYNLDLELPFFDSLKDDYDEFETWILDNANRRCWSIKVGSDLAGLCIYKHDEAQEHSGITLPSVKLCTFKVSEGHNGRKFGELLLKMAFNYATRNHITSIWVTAHEKQVKLIQFLRKFGFLVHKDLKKKDMIFYKLMQPPAGLPEMKPLDFHILYSPHLLEGIPVRKFVVPIQSSFHDILFPEVAPQLGLGGFVEGDSIPGNTIRKVYLSHSPIKEIPAGSIILFYRSAPEQYIRTRAIVERARRLTDMESLAAAIGKRSVYSLKQVNEMIEKEVLVIDFRLVDHLETPIPLKELVSNKIFNNRPPQSIMEISDERYSSFKGLRQS